MVGRIRILKSMKFNYIFSKLKHTLLHNLQHIIRYVYSLNNSTINNKKNLNVSNKIQKLLL